eukprot:COSAG06_NODE_10987_length_1584_cov_191.476768_1_plen_109_part_00
MYSSWPVVALTLGFFCVCGSGHHCGIEWNEEETPPHADIWEGWNLGRAAPAGDVVAEPPWWEKYELPFSPAEFANGEGACPAVPLSRIAEYQGGGVWQARLRGNEWAA